MQPQSVSQVNHQASAEKREWFGRLTPAEIKRRTWHMLPGLFPFMLWVFPHDDPMTPILRYIIIGIGVVIAGGILKSYTDIKRSDKDTEEIGAVLGYSFSVIGMMLAFQYHLEWGLMILIVLAFGDGSATLGGILIKSPKLPWNDRKSWAGLICFVLVSTPLAAVIYWGEVYFNTESIDSPVPFSTAILCATLITAVAALAESIPVKLNDNIRVGVSASLTLLAFQYLYVGWPAVYSLQ